MKRDDEIEPVFKALYQFKEGLDRPSVGLIAQEGDSPFKVLLSTIISLRTKDEVTLEASIKLFQEASTPQEIIKLSPQEIETLIYPCGFYRRKAQNLIQISKILIDQYYGLVPSNKENLLSLPGVGLKTVNLVLALGFHIPAICVDTHVHRMCNRLGWVRTDKPDITVTRLENFLPKKYWIDINELMVLFGQQICTPQSPKCSYCSISIFCPKRGVKKQR